MPATMLVCLITPSAACLEPGDNLSYKAKSKYVTICVWFMISVCVKCGPLGQAYYVMGHHIICKFCDEAAQWN